MAIKGILLPNRVQSNKYRLEFLPDSQAPTFISVSGLEAEIDAPELPDRTVRSGGRIKPVEFEVVQPMHHDITGELAFMETWWQLCQNSLPGYLKIGVYTLFDEYGLPRRIRELPNTWINKRSEMDAELESDGEMMTITWTMKCDDIVPIL